MKTSAPSPLICHGAVYGKADGLATGYRWLELTESNLSGIDLDRLIGQLSLGQEDLEEGSYYAWRNLGNRYCAARVYLSSARDASGRSGIVEKAILLADGPEEFAPRAALSMFRALDPAVFGSHWWETRLSRDWENRDYHLPGIEKTLDWAAQEDVDHAASPLRDHPDDWHDRLRPLAAGIAAPRPAVLELPKHSPIPDYHLIVALLELLAAIGTRTSSIAGWFPSVIGAADTLSHWDIIVAEEGRIMGREAAVDPGGPAEEKLRKLFAPRAPEIAVGGIRAGFESEIRRFADPESMPSVAALQASFPRLEPEEIDLLKKTIEALQQAQDATPVYLRALDRGMTGEFRIALARKLRLRVQVERLQAYMRSARPG